ncbi:MAG: hypothetical protein SNJ33_05770 [Rikenellaceae bacterium]
MKDILITVKMQRREMLIVACSVLAAFVINFIAIICYKTDFSELYTQWLWTLIVAGVIYGLTILSRIFYYIISLTISKRRE